ncbi:MAG: threonylcarbamoyl-AMP synthase [Acidobacteria bacterium]|nr:threonylcarbamoyl-AMP synthase [Acidobacteriota bacterium]
MTEVVRVDPARPDHKEILRAAECLRHGGLVAFPTETVYGLGVHALDGAAVQRLFLAKGRPANDPLIVHVPAFDQVAPLVVALPDEARALAARFWPGPLTLVMRRARSVPLEVTAGLDTVAIRVPAHPVAHALLVAAAIPVAAPSANLFSRPSPTLASHVLDDLNGRIDMVIDAGPTQVGVESTVLDLTVVPPTVLRPGAISLELLRTIVPGVLPSAGPLRGTRSTYVGDGAATADDKPMASPGLLSKHYAPRAPLTVFQGESAAARQALRTAAREAVAAGLHVGVLSTTEDAPMLRGVPVVVTDLGSEHDVETIAARLYAALRELDAAHVDMILARDVPRADGLWCAVRDRLHRAAAHVTVVD